jgi:DNA gyrase subunit B
LDDYELHARLTQFGLEDTRLSVRRPGQPPQLLESARLAELLCLIEDIERQARVLARRGIPLREFMARRAADGRLPLLRGQVNGEERFFFSEDEFQAFRRERVAQGASVVKNELSEVRILQDCLARLAEFGCQPGDLFLRREEQITGDLAAAVFVLENPHGEPVELENLLGLPAGIRAIGTRGREIKRFKGLGEMNKDELWETTMNPANRILRRVIVGEADDDPEQSAIDAVETDTMFSILMGEDVEKRKNFITENAIRVKNLDI